MSLDASTLQVIVKGDGITSTADALEKLAKAGDRAERSTNKLSKAGQGADAAAKAQAKVWYDLVDKVSKAKEREFNALQRHNNRVYGLMQAEANRMNKQMDRITQQDAANFAKRRAAEQKQLEALDQLRHKAASKEYARAQAEGNRLNTLLDRQRKQQEAAAKASAERQRVQNATYSSSSLAQQIATLQRAQAYSNQGGNVSSRYGSNVAGAMSSGELERLQRQYRQLQLEARRANSTMADTHAAVRGLSGSLGALWMTYGNLLPLIGGAAIGMAVKGVVSIGQDVEHTLEKIRVLGQATTAEIDQMRAKVSDLGKGVHGPRDVAAAMSVLTLAGLNAKQALQGVGATLNLAVTGDVSIEKAASTLVQVSTALGYTSDAFDHISDVISKTAAVSMSSVDSISGAFLSAAAVGEVYGASLNDIGVALAAVANLGIQGTAAGTTVKNFYADLSKNTEKTRKTLAAMGLTLRDLKGADGYFLPIVEVIGKLEGGFSRLNKLARPEAINNLYGERGVKTGAALQSLYNQTAEDAETYKNRLEEIQGQIQKAAVFSTLAAIAMAQTTKNQLKSVGNTIQTVLGEAFTSIAPQIGIVARELKAAFNSPEFASGLKTIVMGVADLTVAIVKNFDWIVKVAAAYAAFKVATFAAGLVTIAKGFTLASIGARAFAVALGPIGVAIAGLTALWAIYKANKNDALNNTAGAQNLSEFNEGVVKAAQVQEEVNAMKERGASDAAVIAKQQLEADKSASEAAVKASKKGLQDMEAQRNNEWASLNAYQKKRVELVKAGQAQFAGDYTAQKFIETEKNYTAALATHTNQVKVTEAATAKLIALRQKGDAIDEENARKRGIRPTGDQDLFDPNEKGAKAVAKFHQNEALELNKLRAGYEAKNAAMRQGIELGKHVAAEAQQAIVLENLAAGKYGSKSKDNTLYQSQMRLAMMADEAKAENERLKKVNEFATKLAELEAAQKAYNAEAVEGSMTHFGALRKEAEGLIAVTSISEQAAEALRKRADAADAYKKSQEAIVKLNSAADSSRNRAEEAKEEAEMMRKYGEDTKLGAMAVAELVIQKSKLDNVTGNVAKSALREAAATEQLNTAYRDLAKQQIELNKAVEDAQAESKLIFVNSEAEKVKIANETRKKLLDIEYQKAQDAFNAKAATGKGSFEDFEAMAGAYNIYLDNISKADQLASIETNNLKLKDWKKTIDDIEQIGREGFYNLTEKGVGLWKGMANTFKSMFKTTVMDYIYKQFAKPIMMKVIASLAGVVGADGLAAAAGVMGGGNKEGGTSASGIMSAVSTAKTLYSTITGGFAAVGAKLGGLVSSVGNFIGSSSVSAFGAGMGMTGAQAAEAAAAYSGAGMGSTGSAISAGSTAGSVASIAAGIVAGHFGGRAISGGYSAFGGSGNGIVNGGTAAGAGIGAIFGGPLGSAIGAAIGGIAGGAINRLFGRKAKEVESEGIRGTITSDMVTGEGYSNWLQKGGLFRSDKRGTDKAALGDDVTNSLQGGFNALKATTSDFAKNLGLSADALVGYSKTFNITLTKDAEKNNEALAKFFTDLGDEMTKKLVPNIMDFAKQGETAAQAMERLSGVFDVTKNLADLLGKSVKEVFGSDGMDSAKVRSMLVDLSGGVDALSARTTAYVNAIYSDTEKLAPVQKALADAMGELGFSSVTTKEQYRAAVEGIKLTDESQIKLFNSLLELAPAFGQVTDAAQAAKDAAEEAAKVEKDRLQQVMSQRLDLEGRITELTKDTVEATRVLAAQRVIELDEMDASLRPLQERVWLLEDEVSVAEKAKHLMVDRLSLEGGIAEITKDTAEASRVLAAQRQIELSEMDASLVPLQERLWLLEAEATAAEKAASLMNDRLSLESTVAELTKNTSEAARVLAAQRAIELATMDESLKPLQERVWALQDEANAAEKLAEKQKEARDKAMQAAEDALSRLSVAIDAEKDNIDKKYNAVIDKVKKAAEASVEAAEKQKEAAEKQRDAVKGILDNINAALKSTVVESVALTRARRTEAQGYLAVSAIQARAGGSVTNMQGLDNALEAIAKPSEDLFSSFEEYARDQAWANHNLAALQGTAQTELTAAELTIERLNATIEAIQKASESQIAAFEKARDAEKTELDNILDKAQEQLDALKGIDNSILGVIEALNSFNASMAAVIATQIQQTQGTGAAIDSLYKSILGREADAGGKQFFDDAVKNGSSIVDVSDAIKNSTEYKDKTVFDLYKKILGRDPDAAGMAFWQQKVREGVSLTEIEKAFRGSAEQLTKLGIPSYAVGTDYVPQDGLAMIHKGEMVVPATDAADIRRARTQSEASSEMTGMKAELQGIKQAIIAGDVATIQTLKEMLRLDKKWDQEGLPETRNVELDSAMN